MFQIKSMSKKIKQRLVNSRIVLKILKSSMGQKLKTRYQKSKTHLKLYFRRFLKIILGLVILFAIKKKIQLWKLQTTVVQGAKLKKRSFFNRFMRRFLKIVVVISICNILYLRFILTDFFKWLNSL